jgi:hypothetical protein
MVDIFPDILVFLEVTLTFLITPNDPVLRSGTSSNAFDVVSHGWAGCRNISLHFVLKDIVSVMASR